MLLFGRQWREWVSKDITCREVSNLDITQLCEKTVLRNGSNSQWRRLLRNSIHQRGTAYCCVPPGEKKFLHISAQGSKIRDSDTHVQSGRRYHLVKKPGPCMLELAILDSGSFFILRLHLTQHESS